VTEVVKDRKLEDIVKDLPIKLIKQAKNDTKNQPKISLYNNNNIKLFDQLLAMKRRELRLRRLLLFYNKLENETVMTKPHLIVSFPHSGFDLRA